MESRKNFKGKSEHDPTLSSVFPPSVQDLRKIGENDKKHDIRQDAHGRTFHEIVRSPRDQMFLARLLKGVLPVSDIVYVPNEKKFYSYEMPGEDTSLERDTRFEPTAELIIFIAIFHDTEHVHLNFQRRGGGYHYYDFDEFSYFWKQRGRAIPIIESTNQLVRSLKGDSHKSVILKRELNRLRSRVEGGSGLTFMEQIVAAMEKEGAGAPSVLEKAEDTSVHDHIVAFQKEVLNRISELEDILTENGSGDIKR